MSDFLTDSEPEKRKPLSHSDFLPETPTNSAWHPPMRPELFSPHKTPGPVSPLTAHHAQGLFGHYADDPLGLQGLGFSPFASLLGPKKPTLDDYRGHEDHAIDDQIQSNRELRALLDSGGPIRPEITDGETTKLNADREELLKSLKDRSGTYDTEIGAISKQLPEKLPKDLTKEQQELLKQKTELETEKNKYSDQQTALQRWHDRREINSINEQLKDPKLTPEAKQKLLDTKKTLATGLLSTTKQYEQFDERWGDTVYGKDKTYTNMTEAGCGPTGLAMLMDFADQEDPEGHHSKGEKDPYSPRKMADYATNHGRVKGSGTDGSRMMKDLSGSFPGFEGKSVDNLANSVESLRNGIPVMFLGHNVHGTRKDGTDTKYGGHFMTLTGVSDDGKNFNVNDGGRNKNRNIRTMTDKQLKDGSSGYWNVKHNTH